MTLDKGKRKSPHIHLAMMVSFCAVLAGCETTGQQASTTSKSQRQVSGQPQLAPAGQAVARIELPATPAETLYPVTVAFQPAVDPVLAAETVDPGMVPGAVPVPRPSPNTALAFANPAQQGAAVAALQSAAGASQSGTGIPAEQAQSVASASVPASPLAVKGGRPGAPVAVASAAGIPASVMLADQQMPQQYAVPRARPVSALGYAGAGSQNAALAAINGNASSIASTAGIRMDPTGADRDRIDDIISRYSLEYGVPEKLVHRVVHRESRYNSKAFNRNGYFGLMQISYPTAKSMGYDGPPGGLLDAETNLKYAIKYLRGAYIVADTNHDNAVRLYARGYYYDAKRKGMLDVLSK